MCGYFLARLRRRRSIIREPSNKPMVQSAVKFPSPRLHEHPVLFWLADSLLPLADPTPPPFAPPPAPYTNAAASWLSGSRDARAAMDNGSTTLSPACPARLAQTHPSGVVRLPAWPFAIERSDEVVDVQGEQVLPVDIRDRRLCQAGVLQLAKRVPADAPRRCAPMLPSGIGAEVTRRMAFMP